MVCYRKNITFVSAPTLRLCRLRFPVRIMLQKCRVTTVIALLVHFQVPYTKEVG